MVRPWLIGLTTGLIVGVGILVGGFLAALLGLTAVGLLSSRLPRDAPVGGFLVGFGAAWIALLIRADISCRIDCVGPDLTGWYLLGAFLSAAGLVLTIRLVRRAISRQERPSRGG